MSNCTHQGPIKLPVKKDCVWTPKHRTKIQRLMETIYGIVHSTFTYLPNSPRRSYFLYLLKNLNVAGNLKKDKDVMSTLASGDEVFFFHLTRRCIKIATCEFPIDGLNDDVLNFFVGLCLFILPRNSVTLKTAAEHKTNLCDKNH